MGQAVPRIFRCLQVIVLLLFVTVVAFGSEPLTNEIIIKMVQAGVPTDTIIRTIQSAESFSFGTLPGDLMQLQQAKVPDEIIRALAARINWPGSPQLVIAHPVLTPAPAAAPQKAPKVKTAPARHRQPVPALYPVPAPTATASIGLPVAATPAPDPLESALTGSNVRSERHSFGASLARWTLAPFRLLSRLWHR